MMRRDQEHNYQKYKALLSILVPVYTFSCVFMVQLQGGGVCLIALTASKLQNETLEGGLKLEMLSLSTTLPLL
jgi:hypothetical protein